MTQQNISRRKFMAASSAVAASVLALAINQPETASAQKEAIDPDETINTIDHIAPSGIVQNRVDGVLRDELAQISRRAAITEYEALASGSNLVTASGLTPTRHQEIDQRITNIRVAMAEDGLRYTNYTIDSQIAGIWAERETASVIWTEKVVYNLAGDPDPNAPQISFETKTHLTSLRKDGGDWYIAHDDEHFEVQPLVSDPYNPPTPIINDSASTQRQYRVHLPLVQSNDAGKLLDHTTEKPSDSEAHASSPLASYSRVQAAAYAQQYGPGGMDGYYDYGNNCTNFVSRCLRAGGWTDRLGYYKSTDGWWYHGHSPVYASYTWHNCRYWYWFTLNQQRGTLLNNIWDLWMGDVLLYDFNKDGYCDHAAICHHRSSNGTLYMAQHTSNYAWKSLSEIVAGQNWWFYPFRMNLNF